MRKKVFSNGFIPIIPIPLLYPEFIDETEVIINGYDLDAMEPFISSDGEYLFFNSLNDRINTSLYYAIKTNDTNFIFAGEVSGVNGTASHLDAVASMDINNIFYFVSTRNYPAVFDNLQTGQFDNEFDNGANGTVTNIKPVTGNFNIHLPGWLIMDAEINKDGNMLYYVNARFSGQPFPDEAKLGIAVKQDSLFNKLNSSDDVLKNINNPDYLVYAPSISSDGKELYFTRIKKGTFTTEIYVSVRADEKGVFSLPKIIKIPGNVVEAPTLTEDRERLYYHKKLSIDGKFHIFTMARE